jgi:hypothetical protein
VKDRFTPPTPVTRTLTGTSQEVHEAARLALAALGYEVERGGTAGRLEGVSRIGSTGAFGSARQREISIRFRPMDGGQVEVAVELKEAVEESSDRGSGTAMETPLRDSAAYDAFFAELARRLAGQPPK